jgi:hypothetical protein
VSGNDFLKKEKRNKHRLFIRGNAVLLIALLLLITFFLTSCDNTIINKEKNIHVGLIGASLRFVEQAPPNEIYENSSFSISIIAENKGAYDLIQDKYGILSLSYDPLYIDASSVQTNNRVVKGPSSILFKYIQLNGKSMYYPTGSLSFLTFSNFKTSGVLGQREKPITQLMASFCYPYVTVYSGIVCLDLSIAGTNLRRQVCTQKNLALSGGQGAPVAITLVEVENQPVNEASVRPVFTLHIQNVGAGNVLSPAYNPNDFERVCSFSNLNRQDFNTVDVQAILSTSKILDCVPNPVKLYSGEGLTRCQVKDNDLIIGSQNYETSLNINLSYVYLNSVSKEIAIKRLNVYGGDISPNTGCNPYEINTGSGCEIKCRYCASNPGDGRCQPRLGNNPISMQIGFDCQCSRDKCSQLYPKGLCIMDDTFCAGGSYCCMPECSSSQVRINGDCYNPCSSCTKAGSNCACGSSTTNAYSLMQAGNFCCPKNSQTFADVNSCTNACK